MNRYIVIRYASGLVFITPLGDLVRRRPLVLLLIFTSASLTIGLALTRSLVVFEVLSFLIAFSSVTPQASTISSFFPALPLLLSAFGDGVPDVREAAQDAARALMRNMSG